ncbi:MAG TPA: mechanosensitive ion channel domain-containing protein [Gammaproteobacteria bacterium]|nr:mechanosensitive ion channel domain-containing protein [Gammaproteobacteria bacterium]
MEQFLATLEKWFDPHVLGQLLLDWTGRAVAALAIFVVGRLVVGWASRWLAGAMRRIGLDETLSRFIGSLSYIVLVVMVVLTAVNALGVPTTNFFAILGAAGLAVGLALKDSLSNFSSGVMLVFFRPFRVGDTVKAAGNDGTVEAIGMFSTVLKTADNATLIVPNSLIYAATITNYTAESTRRIEMAVAISYEDSVADAKALFNEILAADKRVLATPAPEILVNELSANSVGMIIRAWVATGDAAGTRSDLLERIKSSLGDGGFNTPYPRMRLEQHAQAAK